MQCCSVSHHCSFLAPQESCAVERRASTPRQESRSVVRFSGGKSRALATLERMFAMSVLDSQLP